MSFGSVLTAIIYNCCDSDEQQTEVISGRFARGCEGVPDFRSSLSCLPARCKALTKVFSKKVKLILKAFVAQTERRRSTSAHELHGQKPLASTPRHGLAAASRAHLAS